MGLETRTSRPALIWSFRRQCSKKDPAQARDDNFTILDLSSYFMEHAAVTSSYPACPCHSLHRERSELLVRAEHHPDRNRHPPHFSTGLYRRSSSQIRPIAGGSPNSGWWGKSKSKCLILYRKNVSNTPIRNFVCLGVNPYVCKAVAKCALIWKSIVDLEK